MLPNTMLQSVKKTSLDVLEEKSEHEEDGGDKLTGIGFYKN